MKALIIADRSRYERFYPGGEFADSLEKIYVSMKEPADEILKQAADADFIAADAISPVPRELIEKMPNLKLIHSEGVAFNLIDLEAADERGIYVCNNAGVNAKAVAEQAVMLMLMVQRDAINGYNDVMQGHQIEKKLSMMGNFGELGECSVGLLGFGAIAKETAKLLHAFDCKVYYNAAHKKDETVEKEYHVEYKTPLEMAQICDIISIHVPVTPETTGMINEEYLRNMKKNAILINTARGEMVDNEALAKALTEGWIAGAGLDTIAPEPVPADHMLIHLPEAVQRKIVFAPHIGGVTENVFIRSHWNIWKAFEDCAEGRRPACVVNRV